MKIIRKLALIVAPVIMLALPFALPAAPAYAFMCPDRTVCFFHNTDYTGTVEEFPATDSQWRNKWITIDPCCRGSVNNNTGSDLAVWSHLEQLMGCVYPHTRVALYNEDGYFYLHYGVANGCQGIPAGP